jgi:hypothetical protein
MDLSTSSFDGDEEFDAEEQEARYQLGLAPQKKLSKRMIERADIRYKANKYGTTQKAQSETPPSQWALYLFRKWEGNLPTANIEEVKNERKA